MLGVGSHGDLSVQWLRNMPLAGCKGDGSRYCAGLVSFQNMSHYTYSKT